jgi:hypothetical protein
MAIGTIHRPILRQWVAFIAGTILTILGGWCRAEEVHHASPADSKPKGHAETVEFGPPDYGFAPASQNLLAPTIELVPPGPDRAGRAEAVFIRQMTFQRKISFHPELSPELDHIVDVLPPRQSTLIRAGALYSVDDVPWIKQKDGTHEICVKGEPRENDYYYALARECSTPEEPERFSGVFALKPTPPPTDGATPESVMGELGGELMMNTYGGGEFVDMLAGFVRETRGDLVPPWDTKPGEFNHHDRAAIDRFNRDMPHFASRIEHYVEFKNVVDEFDGPSGPYVLFNMDAVVNLHALKQYPHLAEFYRKVVPAVVAASGIYDSKGNFWMRTGFERGHIRIAFMVRNGMLTPFNASYEPAGESVALNEVRHGSYQSLAWVHIKSMSLTFGLDNLSFESDYLRADHSMSLVNHMDAVPVLVAPPGIHQVMDFIAGEFMRVLAQGAGGLKTSVESKSVGGGMTEFKAGLVGEYHYSPTLEFLARIGDTIADKHDETVRKEERALGEELLDAFMADYNSARPALIALDRGTSAQ